MSETLECGCVVGYYWCSKHDIYTKSNLNDKRHRVRDFEVCEPEECSCHIFAPCSFCVSS
jgi:hypothetical protein